MDIDLDAGGYEGGFSTLTRYGTMNTSTARIPRKKRSRGNVAQPRTRCRGYANTPEGRELAKQGISSVRVIHADGTEETRGIGSFRKGSERRSRPKVVEARQSDVQRFAERLGSVGIDYNQT